MFSLLDPIGFLGGGLGGGGQGGIANNQDVTNASQDDHSHAQGNDSVYNSGTLNMTDSGATLAALMANVEVTTAALQANSDALGKAMMGASVIAGNTGGYAGAPVAGGASAPSQNTGLIVAAAAAIAAAAFFFSSKK